MSYRRGDKGRTKKERGRCRVPYAAPLISITRKGLGLSSYACAHTPHTTVSPIIKCPVVWLSDYKVPNWLFGQRIHHTATDWGAAAVHQPRCKDAAHPRKQRKLWCSSACRQTDGIYLGTNAPIRALPPLNTVWIGCRSYINGDFLKKTLFNQEMSHRTS